MVILLEARHTCLPVFDVCLNHRLGGGGGGGFRAGGGEGDLADGRDVDGGVLTVESFGRVGLAAVPVDFGGGGGFMAGFGFGFGSVDPPGFVSSLLGGSSPPLVRARNSTRLGPKRIRDRSARGTRPATG